MEGSIYDNDDIERNINKHENSKIIFKKKQLLPHQNEIRIVT